MYERLWQFIHVRNEVTHNFDYAHPNPESFLAQSESLISELGQIANHRNEHPDNNSDHASDPIDTSGFALFLRFIRKILKVATFIVVLLLLGFTVLVILNAINRPSESGVSVPQETIKVPAVQPEKAINPVVNPPIHKDTPETKQVEVKKAEKPPEPPAPKFSAQEWRQAIAAGQNAAIPNALVEMTDIKFFYKKDHFDDLKPMLSLKLTNLSDKTISSMHLGARLYLNKATSPAIDTETMSRRYRPLLLYFGQTGLIAGETIQYEFDYFDQTYWTVPDIINAQKRLLVLNVLEVNDGMKQVIPFKALSFSKLNIEFAP